MLGLNKVMLIGNLGKDPEINTIDGNFLVAKCTLATTETYRDKDGQQHTQTEFHSIVAWRGLAELCQKYLHKGSFVYVEGKLKTRNWEDKEGIKRYVTEIIADQIIMMDKKND